MHLMNLILDRDEDHQPFLSETCPLCRLDLQVNCAQYDGRVLIWCVGVGQRDWAMVCERYFGTTYTPAGVWLYANFYHSTVTPA